MFNVITELASSLLVELARIVTGRLFNEKQISAITKNAIGKYFATFFQEPEDQRAARERVEEARLHIQAASAIINQMQEEMSHQSIQLDRVIEEIEEKRKLAERYGQLAATSHQQFSAFRAETEEMLRKELVIQAEKGRRLRQVASGLIWLFTLVLGAALGTYFKEIVAWITA
jgi:hypothetical protein